MGGMSWDHDAHFDIPKEPNEKWFLTVTLFPKQCALTGKAIPMYTKAYLRKDGRIEMWVDADEFIIARLKGEI